MMDQLTVGWTQARAADSLALYRRVLGLNLILHLLIGLACIFLPYWVSDVFGLPEPLPTGWVRGWGATLILVTGLYVPGFLDPAHHRAPNVIGVLGRLWMATIWTLCGGGFLWFAAFDFLFFLVLAILYLRFLQNTLMSRP
ncbi:hypothetical protein [Ensifer aridi]|uniref:hypothetical protein n=1 Tax=Ensifer aridi TaxID=1708715 RepID=UPI0004125361|nr:hypothetical protein [Ensifer aridi]